MSNDNENDAWRAIEHIASSPAHRISFRLASG
jgi:hypothetical protein